ncbi:MAG TPA: amidohydrolase family protein [Thermoguttaceae bacterium]|nr:amidohydrolase family protein [Thermoguttaceae bacterium]
MTIDVNAYLGHFAFRQLRHNTPDALLRLMDSKGIDRAMVSSAAAITYRNTQSGNEELFAAIRPHRDRLIPMAVINPFYAGWRDDLQICCERFGMRGLRIYPKWHNYALTDTCCAELIVAATERKLPISIPLRVEDYRQRSWLVDVPDIPVAELVELIPKHPAARFILLNGAGYSGSPLGTQAAKLPANYWIEISRLSAVMANEFGQLLSQLGPGRLVFGTGMPFHYPDPALLKVQVLDASEEVKEQIRSRNALALLGEQARDQK